MCAFLVLCLFSVAHAQIDKKVDISWVYMSKYVAYRPPPKEPKLPNTERLAPIL
jgi:hypothetical protein